jgi:hypothetical protein
VHLDHQELESWPCPECGADCRLYDHQPERRWRHLDTYRYQTILHARPPRIERDQRVDQLEDPMGEVHGPGIPEQKELPDRDLLPLRRAGSGPLKPPKCWKNGQEEGGAGFQLKKLLSPTRANARGERPSNFNKKTDILFVAPDAARRFPHSGSAIRLIDLTQPFAQYCKTYRGY